MEPLYVTSLSECELRLIVDMRDVKVDKLFEILRKNDKITYDESPFKPIISDIRSILPKKGCKTIKKVLNTLKK